MERELKLIEWIDSHGATPGWQSIDEYNLDECIIRSVGFIISDNEKQVALAPNYARATDSTPEQANGIMVIPKACILSTSSLVESYGKVISQIDKETTKYISGYENHYTGTSEEILEKIKADMAKHLEGGEKSIELIVTGIVC